MRNSKAVWSLSLLSCFLTGGLKAWAQTPPPLSPTPPPATQVLGSPESLRALSRCVEITSSALGEDSSLFLRDGVSLTRGNAANRMNTQTGRPDDVLRLSLIHQSNFYVADLPVPEVVGSQGRNQSNFLWTEHRMRLEVPNGNSSRFFCVKFSPNFIVADELREFQASPPATCEEAANVRAQSPEGRDRAISLEMMQARLVTEMRTLHRRSQRFLNGEPGIAESPRFRTILEQVRATDWSLCRGISGAVDAAILNLTAFQQGGGGPQSSSPSTR